MAVIWLTTILAALMLYKTGPVVDGVQQLQMIAFQRQALFYFGQ